MTSSWARWLSRSPTGSGRLRPLILDLSTISELLFASKCVGLHPDDAITALSREANVSLITPLIGYARIRHVLPTLLHPPRSVDSVQPEPTAVNGGLSPPPARGLMDQRPHGRHTSEGGGSHGHRGPPPGHGPPPLPPARSRPRGVRSGPHRIRPAGDT